MKHIKVYSLVFILMFSLLNLFPSIIVEAKAGKKFTVSLKKCIDGDTAHFSKTGKTRFLYVDTGKYKQN